MIGAVTNSNDVKAYGTIQSVYKVDNKQDTQSSAKAMLKSVSEHSEVEALGNIQCIAGYAVEIQEEQLKGTFLIVSDSHTIESNRHMMKLTLRYLDPKASPEITTEGSTGGTTVNADGLDTGADAWLGTTMTTERKAAWKQPRKSAAITARSLPRSSKRGLST